MPVIGGDVVIKNIDRFAGGFLNHVNKVMETVRKSVDDEITSNMSLTDHSLSDLASMGHPYSTSGGGGRVPHSPEWLIHKQSGRLLQSKSSGIDKADINFGKLTSRAWVKLNSDQVKYAEYIIWGTSKMIPRDVLQGSLMLKKNEVNTILSQNLKHFVNVAFKSQGTQI